MSDFEDTTISLMTETHKDGMIKFIDWCENNWQHDTKKQWRNEEPYPDQAFVDGRNAAINSIRTAFNCYAEEYYS